MSEADLLDDPAAPPPAPRFRLWDVAARRQPPAEVLPMPQGEWGAP